MRTVEVRLDGRWRDLSAMLLSRGLVLWLHHIKDQRLNETYNRARAAGRRARRRACGARTRAARGPSPDAQLELRVFSDPLGEDTDINDEWVRVTNARRRRRAARRLVPRQRRARSPSASASRPAPRSRPASR